jgi:hypothetical protein
MFGGGVKIKAIEQVMVLFILNFKNGNAAETGDGVAHYIGRNYAPNLEFGDEISSNKILKIFLNLKKLTVCYFK